jgi:hypothetical protein
MAYTTAEARQQMLDDLAHAIDELGIALALLGDAYEQLDEQSGDRMEAALFRPLQVTYGRAQRTHAGFAERVGLPARSFAAGAAGRSARHDARSLLDAALEAIEEADHLLVEIQDSMMPVEVGDAELRARLAELRELVAPLPERGAALLRTLGR